MRHQIRPRGHNKAVPKVLPPKGRPATDYAEFIGQRIEHLMLFLKFEVLKQASSGWPAQEASNIARESAQLKCGALWDGVHYTVTFRYRGYTSAGRKSYLIHFSICRLEDSACV